MVINRKQIINLAISTVIFMIILIVLLAIGLKTIIVLNNKENVAIVLKGFNSDYDETKNLFTIGLQYFDKFSVFSPFLGSIHAIYGAEVAVVFFATLLLGCNIALLFTNGNKKLNLLGDIINKICLLLIAVLAIVVLINFNSFVKDLTDPSSAEIQKNHFAISALTFGIFIPFMILLPIAALVSSTLLNKDVYKGLNIKLIK